MKKWKSAFLIILAVVLLSILFFFISFDSIIQNLPILKGFYQNTILEITTPNSKATVTINGKDYGETPSNIQNLFSGKYTVELKRTTSEEGFYKPHTFNIELAKNTTARINMEIGPDDNLHGVVIYYTEDRTGIQGKGKITITSRTDGTKIYVNDEYLKETPINNVELNTGEYNIKLKTKDYEDIEFPIIVREGYILNIKGYQYPIPITFEPVANE